MLAKNQKAVKFWGLINKIAGLPEFGVVVSLVYGNPDEKFKLKISKRGL